MATDMRSAQNVIYILLQASKLEITIPTESQEAISEAMTIKSLNGKMIKIHTNQNSREDHKVISGTVKDLHPTDDDLEQE